MRGYFSKKITMPLWARSLVVYFFTFSIAFNIWLVFIIKEDSEMIRQYDIILNEVFQDSDLVENVKMAIRQYAIDSKYIKKYRPFFYDIAEHNKNQNE